MDREIISFNAELTPPLYGLLQSVQDLILDVASKRQVPPDFVLAPVLAAISVAIGSKAIVRFNGYNTRLNLWITIIAPSGSNKSKPSEDIFIPLDEIDTQLYVRYTREIAEARELETEEKGKKSLSKSVPKYLIILQDSTPEARNQALFDNPRGILLYRDELSAVIMDMGRYNNSGEMSDMLTIFDGGSLKINRKSQDMQKIEKPYMSMIGGIQPGILAQTFGDTKFIASGFLNRMMVFYPQDLPEKFFQPNVTLDYKLQNDWSKFVKRIYAYDNDMIFNATREAEMVYGRFFDASSRAQRLCDNDYERSVWAKLQIYVVKLAALATVMRVFDEGVENFGRLISVTEMSWAVDMAYHLYVTQMRMYHKIVGGTDEIPPRTKVLQWFMHYYPDINRTQLADLTGMNRKTFTRAASKNQ